MVTGLPSEESEQLALWWLRQLCEEAGMDPSATLSYLVTRISVDEVLRSEAVALSWAEKKYGQTFVSTAGVSGDLITMAPDSPIRILVEVTTAKAVNLRKKALRAFESHRRWPNTRVNKVVGIRVDSKTNKVIEFVEIDISLEK